jgi:hypothetical protein
VAGVASAASGQGATITITASGGDPITVVFNIPTTGATFTLQTNNSYDYGDVSLGPLPDIADNAAQLAVILKNIHGITTGKSAVITQSVNCGSQTPCTYNYGANGEFLPGPQMLNYAAYGLWVSDDAATAGRAGTFAFGSLTPTASVPATGSATFNGTTMGVGGATSGSTVYALQGNAQIIANFATQSVTANLTNLSTQNISTNATGSLPNLSGTSAISGNAYAGTIAGTGLTGTINGNFYGPAAQETAGVWQASGGGNAWIGSYGAK